MIVMTVKELREKLAAFPEEMLVYARDTDDPDATALTADYVIDAVKDIGCNYVMLVLQY